MLADHLPVHRLRLRTERLELRLPESFDELAALADAAAAGVHDPDFMPFGVPWTEGGPEAVARSVALWYHRAIGRWDAQDWGFPFVVFHEGKPIGVQVLRGTRFAVTREVSTGSWIGLAFQGRGLGKEMRAAVLHLAFAELDAEYATSGSYDGNGASAGVSRRLGYREDGIQHPVVQDVRRTEQRWRLDREAWEAHRRHEVAVEGLDRDVLDMLGLGVSESDA
ncbi:GNAT family N-acetyltransferase [Glycomyces sp. TRM65418]|uniref:GNAT family N-acetyltransferase n=1 Tax=Glycomyces sp. TRM65418 TaxID=2867006 RepID=UPI001CE5CD05|nr:GNAT family N-acetyltransferase [Glycomyces sp. TRM65418]MCC3761878.1 GNAT family N-acetyltransferase [Glycomyces sp. TRM65418]QZD55959.1 GNAT family N-acetyltransferase [Glycomyces sp. TRM65418]